MYNTILGGFFSTTIWSYMFPDLLKEYKMGQRIDIRCSFSKNHLTGKIKQVKLSQVWFREKDKLEVNLNFGCGLYVHNQKDANKLFGAIAQIDEFSPYWEQWRSIWTSMTGTVQFDFKNLESMSMILSSIKSIDLKSEEMRVFKNGKSQGNERAMWQQKLDNFLGLIRSTPFSKVMNTYLFPSGLPLSPIPGMEKCLGLPV
jgi:hypothetical protein